MWSEFLQFSCMAVQNDTTKKENKICKTTSSLSVTQEYTSFEQIVLNVHIIAQIKPTGVRRKASSKTVLLLNSEDHFWAG